MYDESSYEKENGMGPDLVYSFDSEDAEKETDANAGKNDGQKDENGNSEPSEGDNQDSEVELPIVPAKPH